MPKKKPDPAPTQPSVPSPESSSLSFTIETFDDPETGKPTQYGRFSRNWQDEEALDVLIDKLEAGQLSHKQALMQARKLEATTPYNLEIQNFIANRLWALGLQDEATEVYERAYKQALAHIPKGFKGQITWGEVDNRPFLRLAHGTLLGLMRRRDKANGGEAMALVKQMLAWCPMDNIGVRFLLGDIALLQGDHQTAMKEYLKGAPNSPAHWYQAALIEFRAGDYVAACTYLRRGIAANPYIAEGLTGRTVLSEHLYWHTSNVHGPEWAVPFVGVLAPSRTARWYWLDRSASFSQGPICEWLQGCGACQCRQRRPCIQGFRTTRPHGSWRPGYRFRRAEFLG